MKPLDSYRKTLIWLYAHPSGDAVSLKKKWIYIICNCAIITGNLSLVMASVAFAMKFISSDLEISLFAFFQVIGYGTVMCVHLSAIIFRVKMFHLFEELTTIFTDSKNSMEKLCKHEC